MGVLCGGVAICIEFNAGLGGRRGGAGVAVGSVLACCAGRAGCQVLWAGCQVLWAGCQVLWGAKEL
eukprot:356186-Chlamydomonas_euryale.AAC.3